MGLHLQTWLEMAVKEQQRAGQSVSLLHPLIHQGKSLLGWSCHVHVPYVLVVELWEWHFSAVSV
jgi:hypothetical protein